MQQSNTQRAQILLEAALNSIKLNRKLMAKALRLGAKFSAPSNDPGTLWALFNYARHGQVAYDADLIVAAGGDPFLTDNQGCNFAHFCFASGNLVLSKWSIARNPTLLDQRDNSGFTPLEHCLGDSLSSNLGPLSKRKDFMAWALSAIDDPRKRAFITGASEAWLTHLAGGGRRDPMLAEEARWLDALGAFDAGSGLSSSDLANRAVNEKMTALFGAELSEALSPILARLERGEISRALADEVQAGRPQRRPSL